MQRPVSEDHGDEDAELRRGHGDPQRDPEARRAIANHEPVQHVAAWLLAGFAARAPATSPHGVRWPLITVTPRRPGNAAAAADRPLPARASLDPTARGAGKIGRPAD